MTLRDVDQQIVKTELERCCGIKQILKEAGGLDAIVAFLKEEGYVTEQQKLSNPLGIDENAYRRYREYSEFD